MMAFYCLDSNYLVMSTLIAPFHLLLHLHMNTTVTTHIHALHSSHYAIHGLRRYTVDCRTKHKSRFTQRNPQIALNMLCTQHI